MNAPNPYLIRAIYEWLSDSNSTPYIAINTHGIDIGVPAEYIKNNELTLNIGPRATRHLIIKNDALECDVSFSSQQYHLTIPIPTILAIYGKENNLGLAFVPPTQVKMTNAPTIPEVSLHVVKQPPKKVAKKPMLPPKRTKKPCLRLIQNTDHKS